MTGPTRGHLHLIEGIMQGNKVKVKKRQAEDGPSVKC
jgi:hypothetical protein